MFGKLADANNPLSQVLFGLALRFGLFIFSPLVGVKGRVGITNTHYAGMDGVSNQISPEHSRIFKPPLVTQQQLKSRPWPQE